MKMFTRSVIVLFWLFAIAAPSMLTLFNTDNPIIVTPLNEEEQQEQDKINVDEEKILVNDLKIMLLLLNQKEDLVSDGYIFLGYAIHPQRIPLPPPESIM